MYVTSTSLAGLIRIRRRTARDAPFMSESGMAKNRWKSRSGRATKSAERSACWMAIDLNVSSPTMMWIALIRMKAAVADAPCAAAELMKPPAANTRSKIPANAGSPIQPRARLASVMPSWVADR